MKIRTITITMVAIALIAIPTWSIAQHRSGGQGGHGPSMRDGAGFGGRMLLGPIGDKLELSDEQRQQIETIIETSRESTQTLRDQIKEGNEAYRANHEPGTFDETSAQAFATTQAGLKAELMVSRMKTKADVFNVLTPEQQEEFIQLRELFGEMKPKRDGKGGHGRR